MSPEHLLLYRSNLLGSDLAITNFGGGNTSAKLEQSDPLTNESTTVLWVKGSGGDLGSMKLDGFSTLYLDKLRSLEKLYRGDEYEDEMVAYLPHCTFDSNPRAASIDTPLHAYLDFPHIDHVHPDVLIALAAASNGEEITAEIWGESVGWLSWQRPGFELAMRLRALVASKPDLRAVMLAGHGVICWGDTSKSCYENTLDLVNTAAKFLNQKLTDGPAFGGQALAPLSSSERRARLAQLAPVLRGLMSADQPKVCHYSDEPETLEFVCSEDFERLAAMGTSCPDHFLRTKIKPLTLDPTRLHDEKYLEEALELYRLEYKAYYDRCSGASDPAMRDSNPVVVLIPAVGRITFAANKPTARIAGEFYANAINVMRGAEAIGNYQGLDEQEAFNIEYWALEEAKLQRMPKPKPLAGKIALVTGAAGGIGLACVRRLASEGACVMLTDRDEQALAKAEKDCVETFGRDLVRAVLCDVTNEQQVQEAFDTCAVEFGGLDILVANAGLASSAPIEETSVELWRRNYDVLVEGYFLTARAAFKLMSDPGGSVVFIGSKNALAATKDAAAYASAKAASVHLARCLALEGAERGIRVNVVNPDAVIRGSRIWDGRWREERAKAYGIDSGQELEDHYRNRSMLKLNVFPEDIAEAVYYFASSASAKSTGNIINVDAGNAQAFVR